MASKKGDVKHFGRSRGCGGDKMMGKDLNSSEDGDWLVVNDETDIRAGSCGRIPRNLTPKSWVHSAAVMGKLPTNSCDTSRDLHTTSAGYVGRAVGGGTRPPPATSMQKKTNNATTLQSVHPPLAANWWKPGAGGGFDGTGAAKGGCKSRPIVFVNLADDSEEDFTDDEVVCTEDEDDSISNGNSEIVTSSPNGQRNRVPPDGAPDRWWWGHHGVVRKPSVQTNNSTYPSDVSRFPLTKCGQRGAGGGGMPHPSVHPQAVRESEIGSSGDCMGKMREVDRENGSHQIQNRNHGLARTSPPLRPYSNIAPWNNSHGYIKPAADSNVNQQFMVGNKKMTPQAFMSPSNPRHSLNSAARTGPSHVKPTSPASKREAYLNSYNVDDSETDSDDSSPIAAMKLEALRQKCLENSYTRPRILLDGAQSLTKFPPKCVFSRSGAASCQVTKNYVGHKEGMYSNTNRSDIYNDESSDFDDDDDEELDSMYQSEFGNDERSSLTAEESCRYNSEKSKRNTNIEFNWMTKISKETEGDKDTCCAHERDGINKGKDATEQQLNLKLVAGKSNEYASLFEDFKHRAKEMANIIKLRVCQKNENDTCAAERDRLMKIHEEKLDMKKRHWEEEQEVENRFASALNLLMEKLADNDPDRDSTSKL